MTDHAELIARLRTRVPTVHDCAAAADALETAERQLAAARDALEAISKIGAYHRNGEDWDHRRIARAALAGEKP